MDLINRSFAGGEVAPAIYGRADVVKYQTGARKVRNHLVRRHGGLANRPGSQYITPQRDHTARGRLIEFVFNAEQTYLLLFENQTMRVIQRGVLLTVPDARAWLAAAVLSGATAANPVVVTAVGHLFINGDSVTIAGVVGMVELNGNTYTVANKTNDTFELSGIDGIAFTPYVSDGTATKNYIAGDVVVSAGVNYYCTIAQGGHQPPNAVYWYAMPADNVYEVPTPFFVQDLQTLYRSQSGDIVTLTHTGYRIYDLSRTGHTTWVFTLVAMTPSIAAPATLTNNKVNGSLTHWVATAVKLETHEESEPSVATGTTTAPTAGTPITLTIGTVTGALEYNVYRDDGSGIFGFIGVSKAGTFKDYGFDPNFNLTPPASRDPFDGDEEHPACSGYLQQRKCYGGVQNNPETVYGSKTGQYKNFGMSSPLRTDDATTWPMASREVNVIRHIIEVLESFVFTSGVEWVLMGGQDGALTPGSPGGKPKSYYGASIVPPVIIGDNILFVQARGNLVRDLNYQVTSQGYQGRDLSVFAPHLFAGKTIEHWDYAQIPDSIVWAQQDDGSLLTLTYLREHDVWGWAQHDTDGLYEDVAIVPEGTEDAVYVLVNRTINGNTRRYLERFASRRVTDVEVDALFLDCYLTYDGRNTTSTTMTLSGGVDWLETEDLTLTASGGVFVAGDVDNAIRIRITEEFYTGEDGWQSTTSEVILTITAYISPTVVTVNANMTVPASFREYATTLWARGVDQFSGADHLEGKTLAILGDGNVVTNGIDAPATVVSGGAFTLDRPYFVLHAGLPYTSDLETLDLEIMGGETLTSKQKSVNGVDVLVEASRGLWTGEDFDHLREWKQRKSSDNYAPIPLFTGHVPVAIGASWNQGGRVCVRQRDPLPLTILNVTPTVKVGG